MAELVNGGLSKPTMIPRYRERMGSSERYRRRRLYVQVPTASGQFRRQRACGAFVQNKLRRSIPNNAEKSKEQRIVGLGWVKII